MSAVKADTQSARMRFLAVAADMEPTEHQERHSPTEAVTVKMPVYDSVSGKVIRQQHEQARRRKTDSRIWDAFTPEQEEAAMQIQAAWCVLAGDVNVKIAKYGDKRGGELSEDRRVELVGHYRDWANGARAAGFNPSAIMQILCYGCSLSDVDRELRRRKEWAKENLHAGLDFYAALRGWIAHKNTR